ISGFLTTLPRRTRFGIFDERRLSRRVNISFTVARYLAATTVKLFRKRSHPPVAFSAVLSGRTKYRSASRRSINDQKAWPEPSWLSRVNLNTIPSALESPIVSVVGSGRIDTPFVVY